jgi:hypothetical protein
MATSKTLASDLPSLSLKVSGMRGGSPPHYMGQQLWAIEVAFQLRKKPAGQRAKLYQPQKIKQNLIISTTEKNVNMTKCYNPCFAITIAKEGAQKKKNLKRIGA